MYAQDFVFALYMYAQDFVFALYTYAQDFVFALYTYAQDFVFAFMMGMHSRLGHTCCNHYSYKLVLFCRTLFVPS
jgi:hypothetical protein